ncbi:MAG: hypothetical protein LBR15_07335 [Methanobrevibacter sp.]|jgi:hypothetical protein|nr:hypothetical protein [Candidatus Methanovirga australis]
MNFNKLLGLIMIVLMVTVNSNMANAVESDNLNNEIDNSRNNLFNIPENTSDTNYTVLENDSILVTQNVNSFKSVPTIDKHNYDEWMKFPTWDPWMKWHPPGIRAKKWYNFFGWLADCICYGLYCIAYALSNVAYAIFYAIMIIVWAFVELLWAIYSLIMILLHLDDYNNSIDYLQAGADNMETKIESHIVNPEDLSSANNNGFDAVEWSKSFNALENTSLNSSSSSLNSSLINTTKRSV